MSACLHVCMSACLRVCMSEDLHVCFLALLPSSLPPSRLHMYIYKYTQYPISYVQSGNIRCHTRKEFPPSRPHPMLGPSAEGPGGGMGWGGWGYLSIFDIGYWIFICTDMKTFSRKPQKNTNDTYFLLMRFESHRRSESNDKCKLG